MLQHPAAQRRRAAVQHHLACPAPRLLCPYHQHTCVYSRAYRPLSPLCEPATWLHCACVNYAIQTAGRSAQGVGHGVQYHLLASGHECSCRGCVLACSLGSHMWPDCASGQGAKKWSGWLTQPGAVSDAAHLGRVFAASCSGCQLMLCSEMRAYTGRYIARKLRAGPRTPRGAKSLESHTPGVRLAASPASL